MVVINKIPQAKHLIIDMWCIRSEISEVQLQEGCKAIFTACNMDSSMLHYTYLHEGKDVTMIATLLHGHIVIHYFQDRNFLTYDLLLPDPFQPFHAISTLNKLFAPTKMEMHYLKRGVAP